MRIENLRRVEREEGRSARVMADVIWEACERSPFELYFETEGITSPDLESDPHAYLVACLLPAMYFGEPRIRIEAEICPELLGGLETNMRWFQYWTDGALQPLEIEVSRSRASFSAPSGRHAGSFLSGGVDSLAALYVNHENFPWDHPAVIRDCVMVHGFDIGGTARAGEENAYYTRSVRALGKIAEDADVTLIPLRTNVRLLYDDVHFWMRYFHGAAMASVAHVLHRRVNRIYIGSNYMTTPVPWGSHPILNANYGSYALQVRGDGLNLSRLEKVRVVAAQDVALRNLRVCTWNPETGLNCGVCEKCLRTMLELLAVGRLEDAESFPVRHVDPSLLDILNIKRDSMAAMYRELLPPLNAAGYHSIVARLEAILADFEKHRAWEREEDWKGAVKRFDRKWLGEILYRSYSAVRHGFRRPPAVSG